MKNLKRSHKILLILTAMAISACSNDKIQEFQKIHKAPTNNSETGVIVTGLNESKISKILQSNANLKVRVINPVHNIFEIVGGDASTLAQIKSNPDAAIEKNQVFKWNDPDTKSKKNIQLLNTNNKLTASAPKNPFVEFIEVNQGLRLGGELLDFLSVCKLDSRTAPELIIESNQVENKKNPELLFNLGSSLILKSEKSKAKTVDKKLNFLWIVTSNDSSELAPQAYGENLVKYLPDATGSYLYSVVAKDSSNVCQINLKRFYVTTNDKFKPEVPLPDSFAEHLDPNTFWHVFYTGAYEGWKRSTGENITIGIIDSGVNYNHSALSPNIKINTNEIPDNGFDDDHNGFIDDAVGYDFGNDDSYPFDDYGHGSHVSGIAASQVFGAARKAKILPIKVGAGSGVDVASLSGAIRYAVDNGAKILNMSLGFSSDFKVISDAIKYAEDHNVLIVAAAGNETSNNDLVSNFPSNYKNKNVLAVAATDEKDNLTEYSNFGQAVHIAAPGGTPNKPIISSYKKNPRNAQFVGLMGTSMSTPLVVGIAAQVWGANPNLTALQVKEILIKTGRPSKNLEGKILSGKVVDAMAAITAAIAYDKTTGLQSSAQP